MIKNLFFALVCSTLFGAAAITVGAQTTRLTYQGSLKDGSNPANGVYDLEFALFDALSAGNQLGTTQVRNGTTVTNGTFSVDLDFGAQFPGADRFLEIRVRPTGGGTFSLLAPRQVVNSAPYSIKSINAQSATSATNAEQLGGVAANQYLQTNGNGSNLTNLNASSITTGTLNNARLGVVPIANGGTGSTTQNFVDLINPQTIGGDKTFLGTLSGNIVNTGTQFNISGSRVVSIAGAANTFVGINAGLANSAGGNNSFFGRNAGINNSVGGINSFFGSLAGSENTSGNENAFFGFSSGPSNTTGSGNSFFGSNAGQGNVTGTFNTAIGVAAGLADGLTNATAIGNRAWVDRSNSLVLGSIGGINGATFNTRVGIGTTSPNSLLEVSTNDAERVTFSQYANASDQILELHGRKARGSEESPSAVLSGDSLFSITASGFNGTTFPLFTASVDFSTTENWTNEAGGTRIRFRTTENGSLSPTTRMTIDHDGNVGIGTTVPSTTLHVRGVSSIFSTPIAILQSVGTQVPLIFVTGANVENARVRADSQGNLVLATLNGTDKDIYLRAGDDASTDMFIESSSGNVAIGNTNPVDRLEVVGNIRVGTGSTGCVLDNDGTVIAGVCSSDERLKDSITDVPATLDRLTQLRPVHFYWRKKEYPARKFGDAQSFGLIAQEVEQIMPELVTEDESGMKAVRYNKLPILMLQAIKELKNENDSLKRSLQEIRQKQNEDLARHRTEIDELKQAVCTLRTDAAVCR